MRKIYSFMVAAVALFSAASCNKEFTNDQENLPAGEVVTFEASVDGADTKAYLDGKVSKWEATDKITIHNGTTGFEFATSEADVTNEGVTAKFTYVGDNFSGDKFMAVYPAEYTVDDIKYTWTADVEAKTVDVTIPKWQQAEAGSYPKNAAIAVAYTEDNTLSFKNAAALLKFTMNMDNVTHVYFKGNNGETVVGNVKVTINDDKASVVCLENEEDSKIAECYAYDGTFTKGATYYMAVAPQIFEGGVELKIKRNVENSEPEIIIVRSTINKVVTEANAILNLGEIGGMSYTTAPRVEKIYLKPGVWAVDGAWFAAHFFNPIGGTDDVVMTESKEYPGIYEVTVPEGVDKVIFCRMNPEVTSFDWDHAWNQSDNLEIPLSEDESICYHVKEYGKDNQSIGEWTSIEEATAGPTPGKASEWALVGAFSGWADKAMLTTVDANVVVLENVSMKAAEGFLVRKPATDWADKYGAGNVNYLKANHYITTSKDGVDMCLEAEGTYDIYFNISTKKIYVMTAGVDYTKATQQTVSGEEPKQEEPEVTDKVVYLKPNSNWTQSNARFAAYIWGGTAGEKWVSMTAVGDGTYEAHLPEGYDYGCNIIFCRMNPSTTANNWNNKWNQTSDLKTPTDGKNLYTVKAGTWDKGGGTWSVK